MKPFFAMITTNIYAMQRIKLNNQIFSISDQKKRKKKKTLFRAAGRRKEKHPHMFVLETTRGCPSKSLFLSQMISYLYKRCNLRFALILGQLGSLQFMIYFTFYDYVE